MRRLCRVDCTWTPELAYVIGIITSDGNLSPDGRHISITSKDKALLQQVRAVLNLNNVIGTKSRGTLPSRMYFVFQFGDINFYEFLLSLGLTPAKSKTLEPLDIPPSLFSDFLRGCIDGDGSIGSSSHPESKHPQIKLRLCSASPVFLQWILSEVRMNYGVTGGSISRQDNKAVCTLSFGKRDALTILRHMYASEDAPSLQRKRVVAKKLFQKYSTETLAEVAKW